MPDDPTAALQRLLDVEEIQQLKARYFRCMDTKDWDGFGTVLTADAVMDADGYVGEGRDEIVAFLRRVLDGVVTTHHGHTPEITITGPDTATGVWAMFDYLTFPGDPPPGFRGYGHYHEEYVREADGWRIRRVELPRLRMDPFDGAPPA